MIEEKHKKEIKEKILNLILSKNIPYVQLDSSGEKTISIDKTKRFYFPVYKVLIVDNTENDFIDIYFKNIPRKEEKERTKTVSFLREMIKDLRKIFMTLNIRIRIKKIETEISQNI